MSLALLGGANPRVCNLIGPKVRLSEGKWKVNCVGVVDSRLSLHGAIPNCYVDLPMSYEFDGNCIVNVKFDKRGTESHISVFAERI